MALKPGSLVKCVKTDPQNHLEIEVVYTCMGVDLDRIQLITVKGGWEWYPKEFFKDLFGPVGD
jgi:hypothetical protein